MLLENRTCQTKTMIKRVQVSLVKKKERAEASIIFFHILFCHSKDNIFFIKFKILI